MDYKSEYVLLQEHLLKTEKLLALFNEDTVVFQDLYTYRLDLQKIFDSFSIVEKKYLEIRRFLDRNDPDDVKELIRLKKLHESMLDKVVKMKSI